MAGPHHSPMSITDFGPAVESLAYIGCAVSTVLRPPSRSHISADGALRLEREWSAED
jgi:hypothetical protein